MFSFYRNTKSRVQNEYEEQVIDKMMDDAVTIDYSDFVKEVDNFDEITTKLGYDEDLHVKDDWHVNFYKSEYGGLPCRIFSHSECDFIFLQSKDAKMLNEFYDDMTTMQKKRSTSFGRNK